MLTVIKVFVVLLSTVFSAYLIGRWLYLKEKMPKNEKALIFPIVLIISIVSVWIVGVQKIIPEKLSIMVPCFVLFVCLWGCAELLLGLIIEIGMKAYNKSKQINAEEDLEEDTENIFDEDDISEEEYQYALRNFKETKFYKGLHSEKK